MAGRRVLQSLVLAIVVGGPFIAQSSLTGHAQEGASELAYEVLSRRPHDAAAFTQGLQSDGQGGLFESTGLYGRSSLRAVDPLSGEILRIVALPDGRFGEGLALVDDRLIQLTWRSGEAFVWDAATFALLETFEYEGQGWGLCHDGDRLIMSDGSSLLTFRDTSSFEIVGSVEVTLDGEPVDALNELECVRGSVWANVWHDDRILRIDPADGMVDGVLDLAGIIAPHPTARDPESVLNGITYDATTDSYLLTGKRWPQLIEIRIKEAGGP